MWTSLMINPISWPIWWSNLLAMSAEAEGFDLRMTLGVLVSARLLLDFHSRCILIPPESLFLAFLSAPQRTAPHHTPHTAPPAWTRRRWWQCCWWLCPGSWQWLHLAGAWSSSVVQTAESWVCWWYNAHADLHYKYCTVALGMVCPVTKSTLHW